MKKIFVASHVSEVYAPTYPLLKFIKKNYGDPIAVLHPFKSSPLYFVKDFFATLFWSVYHLKNFDVYIGVSSLDVLPGILIKRIDRSEVIIYYSADYSRHRFGNSLLDWLYIKLDQFCSQRADFCWSVSERIREVKRKNGVPEDKNLLVPNGIHLKAIKFYDCRINRSLFYVGHLTKTKGVQDILKALNELNEYRLFIIGDGPYRKALEKLVADLGIRERVFLLGKISNEEVLKKIAEFEIGLAPYTTNEDYIHYCDPVKVKEYLAAGCPVVVSRAVWVAEEIERQNCGVAVKNFADELPAAVKTINQNYQEMSRNAKKFAAQFDWDNIYAQTFAKMNL
jgi:glycosyltransferase involved in cell wall biosynthesis